MSSINHDKLEIVRIGRENYPLFTALIEWRRTGKPQTELSYYDNEMMKQFFDKYNVLDSDTFFIFAAKLGDKLVGYINAVVIPKPDPRLGLLYIDELWVPKEYRNQGIAGMLMKEAFKVAKKLKLWRVRLFVGTQNEVARGFYRKMGYKETDDCKCCEVNVAELEA